MPGILDLAQSMVGTREGDAKLNDYLKTGGQSLDPVSLAWCAAYVNATLEQAGYGGTGSNLAKSFLDYGQNVDPGQIQPGDIGVWNRGDPNGIYGHVGVVQSFDPKTGQVMLVSGNSGRGADSVSVNPYTASSALGFRRAGGGQSTGGSYTPEQRRAAIAAIESQGSGGYRALGPEIARKSGAGPGPTDRAYGNYQVMGSNIPVWTKQVLGREMTPQEFLADDKAQDAVFDKIFGDYVAKYGEEGAASMWFTGKPTRSNAKDVLGTSNNDYIDRYMKGLGAPSASPAPSVAGGGAAPAVAAASPTAPGTPAPSDDRAALAGDLASNVGSAFTTGGGVGAGSKTQMAKPGMTMTTPIPGAAPNAEAMAASRDKLAMAMARLNSGKLWV